MSNNTQVNQDSQIEQKDITKITIDKDEQKSTPNIVDRKDEDDDKSICQKIFESFKCCYESIISIPLFCRLVSITTLSLLILRIINTEDADIIALIPNEVLGKYHIWSLLSGPFVPSGIISYLSCIFLWIYRAKSLENSLGTIRFSINFFIDCFFTSLLYFGLAIILPVTRNWVLNGLFAVTICQITLLCLANPSVKLSLIFCNIEAKFYPIIISLILGVVHLGKCIDILAGLSYAFLYFYLLRIYIPDTVISKIEAITPCCAWFSSFKSISKLSDSSEKQACGIKLDSSFQQKTNREEISLDKSSDRAKNKSKSNKSNNVVNYINLEDDKMYQ